MSDPKEKLVPEDRVITSLQSIRFRLIDLISEVNKEMDYIASLKERDPIRSEDEKIQ